MANPYYFPRQQRTSPIDAIVRGLQAGLTLRQMMMQIEQMGEQQTQQRKLAAIAEPYLKPSEQVTLAPGYSIEEGGEFAQAPLAPQLGPEQTAQVAQQMTQRETRPPTLQDIATGLAIRSGNPAVLGQILTQQQRQVQQQRPINVGAGGAVYDPVKERVLFQNPAVPRPPADIVNRTFQQVYAETGDSEAAQAAAAAVRERLSKAGATGATQGRVDVQLTPEARQGAANVSGGTAQGRAAVGAREDIGNLTQAAAILDEMDEMSKSLITATDMLSSNVQGGKLLAQKYADGGSLAAVYDARKKNLAEALARNIGGVKGTATEGDIERMVAGAPGFRDTVASRDYKIAALRNIIATAVSNKEALIDGKPADFTAARAQFKKLVDDFLKQSRQTPAKSPSRPAAQSAPATPAAKSKEERLKALGFD